LAHRPELTDDPGSQPGIQDATGAALLNLSAMYNIDASALPSVDGS